MGIMPAMLRIVEGDGVVFSSAPTAAHHLAASRLLRQAGHK
jgi:hypothetical protein